MRTSTDRPQTQPQLRECQSCGLFQMVPALAPGMSAQCVRCPTILRRTSSHRIDHIIALATAAFVLLAERLRADAVDAVSYFAAQGVELKVISGDSPHTVSAVARRAGILHADQPVDARELPADLAALGQVMEGRSVFGRVSPRQKQRWSEPCSSAGTPWP